MKPKKATTILLYAFALLWTINCLFPLLFSLLSSTKNSTEILTAPFRFPNAICFDNYKYAIEHGNVLQALANSLVYALLSTALITVLSLLAAYALTRMKLAFSRALMLFYVAGLTIPIYATLVPLSQVMTTLNLRNKVIGIVLVYSMVNLSFFVYTLSGYMKSISRELDEAAYIDGCGRLQILIRIISPLMLPAISSCAIITFLRIYNDLILGVLFLSDSNLLTVSISLLSFKSESYMDYGGSFAGIILSILPLIILYIAFQKKIVGGLTDGAVKG